MKRHEDRFIIVTGGPGAGKSTLIDALRAIGFAATDEAGRAIIRDQTRIGRPDLPREQPVLFGELMLSWEMRSYRMASAQAGPVFFDRAIPELAGYALLIGPEVPPHVHAAAQDYRYRQTVFLAPVWPEIFVQDAERRQTLEDAWRVQDAVRSAYADYGYEVVELPRADVPTRLEFLLAACGLSTPVRPRPGRRSGWGLASPDG